MKTDYYINLPGLNVFGDGLATKSIDTCLFLYANGQVNWIATDYLMSLNGAESSRKVTKGDIRYFLEFLDGDEEREAVALGEVNDDTLFKYVEYITDDIGLLKTPINRRVSAVFSFLEFIQDNYSLDYLLIAITPEDADDSDKKRRRKGYVNVTRCKSKYKKGQTYLHHECKVITEDYGSRNPITEEAITAIYDELDDMQYSLEKRQDDLDIKQGEIPDDEYSSELHKIQAGIYRVELLYTLTSVLEYSGVRVSEAANIDSVAIELLRSQLEHVESTGDSVTIDDIISRADVDIKPTDLQTIEAIYHKAIGRMKGSDNHHVWLKIRTTKGLKKDKLRIVPIPASTARRIVDFYDDYIVEEVDKDGFIKVNRRRHKRLFVQPSTGKPMTGSMLSKFYYDAFRGKIKKHRTSPHLFRHRYITKLVIDQLKALNRSMGNVGLASLILKRIMGLTGHASIDTMLHYVEIAEAELSHTPTSEELENQLRDAIKKVLSAHDVKNDDLVGELASISQQVLC